MKRNMELCRKLLFEIEKQYVDVALINLKIEGHETEEIAYHCKLLYDAGLVNYYSSQNADNHIWSFTVGSLTWEGHNFLDNIREESVWRRTKKTIQEKSLPMTLEVIKEISKALISMAVKATLA